MNLQPIRHQSLLKPGMIIKDTIQGSTVYYELIIDQKFNILYNLTLTENQKWLMSGFSIYGYVLYTEEFCDE